MKLYLSSTKLGNRIDVLKKWIKENNNKILLITNARDLKENNNIEKEKIKNYSKMLEDIGFKVELLDLRKYFENKEKLYNKLNDYKAFCVIGGNVFVLRKAMNISSFDKFLQDNKNNNILYIGWSAGSCVLSKYLEGLQIVDEPINPYNNDEIIYGGIGFIDKLFVPHYKSEHKESHMIDKVIKYLEKNNLEYETYHDGEVLIKDI